MARLVAALQPVAQGHRQRDRHEQDEAGKRTGIAFFHCVTGLSERGACLLGHLRGVLRIAARC